MGQILSLFDMMPGAAEHNAQERAKHERMGRRILTDAEARSLKVGQKIRIENDMWGRRATATVVRVTVDPRGGGPYYDIVGDDAPTETSRVEPHYFRLGPQLHYFGSNEPDATPAEVAALLAGIAKAQEAAALAHAKAEEQAKAEEAAGRAIVEALGMLEAPAWIVAALKKDMSDGHTDYYASRDIRTVVLAPSAHKRDIFSEMRKAAALALTAPGAADRLEDAAEDIAALADAPADWEHREKYSQGHGYYLGQYRHSGWEISKEKAYGNGMNAGLLRAIGRGDHTLAIPAEKPAPVAAPSAPAQEKPAPAGFSLATHTHTMKGRDMSMVVPGMTLEKARWLAITERAKNMGGWWSRAWGAAPGGWSFWADAGGEEKARALLAWIAGDDKGPDGTPADAPEAAPVKAAPASKPVKAKGHPAAAAKVRALGQRLAEEAAGVLGRERLENTPKRQKQAASARIDGERAKRAAGYLVAWADAADLDALPAILANAPTKAEALSIARRTLTEGHGYYEPPYESDTYADTSPRAVALRSIAAPDMTDPGLERKKALAELRHCSIPGFFPTPAEVIARMLEAAGPLAGKTILEPSAGIGSIVDAAIDAGASPENITVVEDHCVLVDFLRKFSGLPEDNIWPKDFMAFSGKSFDICLMNPPYEKDAWLHHVKHAANLAHKTVAVVPSSARRMAEEGGTSKVRQVFKTWAEGQTIEWIEVDPKAFAKADAFRQTGTATIIMVIG
jgi:hypothetical protein